MTVHATALRRFEIQSGLDEVRHRIEAACAAAGRSVDDVTLVVVTKTFPASDVELLHELGCLDVAENRDQEARQKVESLASIRSSLRWHMIGQLQRNKARSVAGWADVVESVDRLDLADALSASAVSRQRTIDVLIQVSLDPDPLEGRGGIRRADVGPVAEAVSALPGLRLSGVMGVAPHPGDPNDAFALLREAASAVQLVRVEARTISAGMSGDLEQAIAHGATQVRIGGAILGKRAHVG